MPVAVVVPNGRLNPRNTFLGLKPAAEPAVERRLLSPETAVGRITLTVKFLQASAAAEAIRGNNHL